MPDPFANEQKEVGQYDIPCSVCNKTARVGLYPDVPPRWLWRMVNGDEVQLACTPQCAVMTINQQLARTLKDPAALMQEAGKGGWQVR